MVILSIHDFLNFLIKREERALELPLTYFVFVKKIYAKIGH